jgi:hypothetical protein
MVTAKASFSAGKFAVAIPDAWTTVPIAMPP